MRERLRQDILELSGLLANFSIPLWQLAIFPALSSLCQRALVDILGGLQKKFLVSNIIHLELRR
jgi:hypothetical protein